MTPGVPARRRSPPTPAGRQGVVDEILAAGAEAFARRGYAGTSVEDIADLLGCTKGRVYHYFRTKTDVYLAMHHQALEWALAAVRPASEDRSSPPSVRLREMVSATPCR